MASVRLNSLTSAVLLLVSPSLFGGAPSGTGPGQSAGDEATRDPSAAVPTLQGSDPRFGHDPLPRSPSVSDTVREIRAIRRQHFGSVRVKALREEGFEKLRAFKDPNAITPLYEELRSENDDVVLALLDHVASLGEPGQAALTWMAIMDGNAALRNEATRRIRQPVTPAALGVLDAALRQKDDILANRAGALAGTIGAVQAIPLLVAAQSTEREVESQGDLAWIAIQTQRSYVSNLIPVTGDNAGAFQPVIGVIGEGVVFRIMDAVVITYRTEMHTALVNLTSADWGQSTAHLGYDRLAWQRWIEEEYKPFLAERARESDRVTRARLLEREAAREDE